MRVRKCDPSVKRGWLREQTKLKQTIASYRWLTGADSYAAGTNNNRYLLNETFMMPYTINNCIETYLIYIRT